MQKFNIEFAKLNIEVNCNYTYSEHFCRDYAAEAGKADFSVYVSEKDVEKEVAESPYNPKPQYAESICVYREIAKQLPYFNRMVFHGAVISYNGRGYMFTAPSGTGKTTHISLWKKYLDGVEIVNGDKPIIRIENGEAEAFATPYSGKEGYQNHGSILLNGICIIHRGEENRIRRVSVGEIISEIMNQVYMPYESETVIKTLDLLDALFRAVPVFVLECDISEEAVKTSFEALTGEKYEEQVKK